MNTCFYTNYYFEHNGKRLNDYDELSALDLEKDTKIYMKPDLYNERTARAHYKKFKEVLYSPSVLNLSNDISDSLSAAINSVVKPNEADSTQPATEQFETTKTEGEGEVKETTEKEVKEEKSQEAAGEGN